MSQSLRGVRHNTENPVSIIEQMKGFMQSLSSRLDAIQNKQSIGDIDGSGKAFKDLVGDDIDSILKTSKDLKKPESLDVPLEEVNIDKELSSNEIISLKDVPNSLIGEQIQPEIIDQLASLSSDFAHTLDDLDMTTLLTKLSSKKRTGFHQSRSSGTSDTHGKKPKPKKKPQHQFDFGKDSSFFQTGGVFGENFMEDHPTVQSIHKQVKMHRKGISLPSINSFVSVRDHETVMSKHQQRKEEMGVCEPECSVSDKTCNCGKLFSCIKKMDDYDMAV